MARVVGRVHLIGAGAEGVGPTLLLTMHKRGQYSTDETLCEAVWFNISDCACRVANATRVKLSATSAVFVTRVAPCHLSGLPSLVFHLSTAGTEALMVHGPAVAPAAASLRSYVNAMNAFVVRQFPGLTVVAHGDGPATASSPVHDSRGIGAYGAWKGRAGLRVWALPVRSGAADEEARSKRRRVTKADSEGEAGAEPAAAAETIACCYLLCVDSSMPFVLLLLDCPSPSLASDVGAACDGIRALCPTPPSLVLHLAGRGVTASGEYAALLLQLREAVQLGARHVFASGGGPEAGSADTRWTHFPRAAAHTAALNAACPALYPLLLHPPAKAGGRPGLTLLLEDGAPTIEEGWTFAPAAPALQPAGGARRVLDGCTQWHTRAPVRKEGSNRGAAAALRLALVGGPVKGTPVTVSAPPLPHVGVAPSARAGYAAVTFLGTGAAAPSALRSCSAIYAQLSPGPSPEGVLIDCGEGALGKLLLQEAGGPSLDCVGGLLLIWISHLHADHHSGLPAVLAARVRDASVAGRRQAPLLVAGPRALRNLLLTYTAMVAAAGRAEGWWGADAAGEDGLHGMCRFVDIRGGEDVAPLLREGRGGGEARDGAILVRFCSVAVEHSGEAYGAIATFALPPDGGTGPTDALVLVYSGDTRPCNALVEAGVEGAACAVTAAEGSGGGRVRVLLVHEATFAEGGEEDGSDCGGSMAHSGAGSKGGKPKRTAAEHARSKRHSTVGEAVDVSCSLAASVQRLAAAPSHAGAAPVALGLLPPVLTHFSARYAPAGDVTGAGDAEGWPEGGAHFAAPFVSVQGVRVLMAADGLRLPLFT